MVICVAFACLLTFFTYLLPTFETFQYLTAEAYQM
jgi:hypothetical protein